jgi:dephospho-CoA kinase
MTVGLTGGYCSGKDEAARIFEKHGFTVIDEDAVGHEILDRMAGEVIAAFGAEIAAGYGRIDRKALGRIVFHDPAALARLEAIVHPAMVAETAARVRAVKGDALINAAILFKMGLQSLCRAVVCIKAPAWIRVMRAMRRDGLRPAEAAARVLFQKGTGPKSYGPAVDIYYVTNRGTRDSLETGVLRVLELLKRGKAS